MTRPPINPWIWWEAVGRLEAYRQATTELPGAVYNSIDYAHETLRAVRELEWNAQVIHKLKVTCEQEVRL